jgi:hypothetical protein
MFPRVALNSRRSNAASLSTGMVPATKPSCTALGSKAWADSSRGAPMSGVPAPVGQCQCRCRGGERVRRRLGGKRPAGRGCRWQLGTSLPTPHSSGSMQCRLSRPCRQQRQQAAAGLTVSISNGGGLALCAVCRGARILKESASTLQHQLQGHNTSSKGAGNTAWQGGVSGSARGAAWELTVYGI